MMMKPGGFRPIHDGRERYFCPLWNLDEEEAEAGVAVRFLSAARVVGSGYRRWVSL